MAEPSELAQEAFAPTREHEYQDPHYHDEEPEIVEDERLARSAGSSMLNRKKSTRRPPPRHRYYED